MAERRCSGVSSGRALPPSEPTLVAVTKPAHLFGVAGAQYDIVHYMTDEAACKERLAELGLKPFGAG